MPHQTYPCIVPVNEAIRKGQGIPAGFYLVLKRPAPLAGCAFPYGGEADWDLLYKAGFRHIVCLSSEKPRYDPFPLGLAIATELDDLSIRRRPVKPAQEAKSIHMIAEFVATSIQAGQGVLIHCAAGRGRTGSVMGVALKLLGLQAPDILAHLNALHLTRSGNPWPESKWQSDLVVKSGDNGLNKIHEV